MICNRIESIYKTLRCRAVPSVLRKPEGALEGSQCQSGVLLGWERRGWHLRGDTKGGGDAASLPKGEEEKKGRDG